jgi:L-fuconolactonase
MSAFSESNPALGSGSTPIIDAQVHVYEPDHPGRPWKGRLVGPDSVTGEEMVAAMDDAGVDCAIAVSSWAFYHNDASYTAQVQRQHPERFRIIAPINPYVAGAVDDVEKWGATPGAVGIRLMPGVIENFDASSSAVKSVVDAAGRYGFPICVYCPGKLHHIDSLASLYPETRFVLDHLGLVQPFTPPVPASPFSAIDDVLRLANHENISVKISAAPTLSHEPFPFDDLWAPTRRYYDAFGIERCMWGSDWTRTLELVSYKDSVAAFRDHAPLTEDERSALMGGTLLATFRW